MGTSNAFNFTHAMYQLCDDVTQRMETFSHIRMPRVAVTFAQTRSRVSHGMQAKLTPLRFENGALITRRRGRSWTVQRLFCGEQEMLYILTFYLPRFLQHSFREKMITVLHELYHISPDFNGDIRRLEGRFVDSQGKAIDAAPVMVVHKGKEVARTMTDADGRFVIKNLRTGDHAICSAQYVQQARLWTEKNAPPSSKTESVIVAKEGVVRGQDGCCLGMGPDFLTLGIVALGVGAIVLGAITLKKVNDLEDQINASP